MQTNRHVSAMGIYLNIHRFFKVPKKYSYFYILLFYLLNNKDFRSAQHKWYLRYFAKQIELEFIFLIYFLYKEEINILIGVLLIQIFTFQSLKFWLQTVLVHQKMKNLEKVVSETSFQVSFLVLPFFRFQKFHKWKPLFFMKL